ncbi:MAG: glycosyltransferase [Candidatus Omnitrophica bacterium]|nr:glycosyltransferase [Candidatus Omnitrophota bacterium]MDD5671690.1 glycosyltransferase [Candidatus Omnitrophota bacterium]
MTKISVMIPTYNRRERLKTAIRSVLAQTDVFFELIIIDDGSEDGTREMVLHEFPDVKYFSFENQGPAAARNRGIERASGEWMAFLDSDDEWLPGKLKAQLEFFSQNPDVLICQTEEIWIRNGRRVNPMKKHKKHGGWIFEACLPLCIVSPSAVMLHRSIFDKIGFFDESLPACEDYDLWLRIAAKYPIGLIETPYIIKYGGHRDQRSREFPAMDRFRIRSLAKLLSSKELTPDQTKAAVKILEEKSRIYCQGARKRGLEMEAAEIQALTAKTLEISTTFEG